MYVKWEIAVNYRCWDHDSNDTL